jgi:U4/U6 small nuclear ribonucleoprotein SNU13
MEKSHKKSKKQVKAESSDDEPVVETKKAAKKVEEAEEAEEAPKSRAWPKADNQMTKKVLDLCNQATLFKQLKKGANETTKSLNRGVADLVVLAADTEPLEIVLHLPLLCEDKNVPYVYVPKQADLGRACGVSRNIVAAVILHHPDSQLQSQINEMKDKVEQLLL